MPHPRSSMLLLATLLLGACSGLPTADIPVAPRDGAAVVVFDIDGTLTPTVLSMNTARPDAAAVANAYANHGFAVVYLSARMRLLQHGIPGWLRRNGFPKGGIHVPPTDADHDDPASFKQRILDAYVARGWRLAVAYGDSSTDFQAYAAAGMPSDHVFALLRDGDANCEPGLWVQCLTGWSAQLKSMDPAQ